MKLLPSRSRPDTGSGLRVACLFAFLLAAAVCLGRPEFLVVFKDTYKPDPSSLLGQAGCATCHTQPPHRNPYGRALQKLVDVSPTKMLTPDMLRQVEGLDSVGNGSTNGDKIRAGLLPGDPSSHPKQGPGKSGPQGAPFSSPLIPSHAYHPVFIHFPIALFLFGMLLEFLGLRKQNVALGTAALWNLSGALTSMAIVVPTGIAALLIGAHKLEGTMLYHLLSGVASLLLMAVCLILRKKRGNADEAYWMALVLAAALICVTGYFGGQLVYG